MSNRVVLAATVGVSIATASTLTSTSVSTRTESTSSSTATSSFVKPSTIFTGSVSSSVPSLTPTPTPTVSNSGASKGAAVGGSLGGGVLVAVVVVFFVLRRRKHRLQPQNAWHRDHTNGARIPDMPGRNPTPELYGCHVARSGNDRMIHEAPTAAVEQRQNVYDHGSLYGLRKPELDGR